MIRALIRRITGQGQISLGRKYAYLNLQITKPDEDTWILKRIYTDEEKKQSDNKKEKKNKTT